MVNVVLWARLNEKEKYPSPSVKVIEMRLP